MTDDLFKLTGQKPISMHDFVKLHAAEFTRPGNQGLDRSTGTWGRNSSCALATLKSRKDKGTLCVPSRRIIEAQQLC